MKQYTKADLELLLLPAEDVILTSSPYGMFDNPDEGEFGSFGTLIE